MISMRDMGTSLSLYLNVAPNLAPGCQGFPLDLTELEVHLTPCFQARKKPSWDGFGRVFGGGEGSRTPVRK